MLAEGGIAYMVGREGLQESRVSLVRNTRNGKKRKCKDSEVETCLECSRSRNCLVWRNLR